MSAGTPDISTPRMLTETDISTLLEHSALDSSTLLMIMCGGLIVALGLMIYTTEYRRWRRAGTLPESALSAWMLRRAGGSAPRLHFLLVGAGVVLFVLVIFCSALIRHLVS